MSTILNTGCKPSHVHPEGNELHSPSGSKTLFRWLES